MIETYDYIVIGAGSAGCIVAARLARHEPSCSILLLDAGQDVPATETTVWDPTQWVLVQQLQGREWGYRSVPQPHLEGRSIPMSRAKALGGCSVHNAMVYVRGGAWGFDDWERQGCAGWGYSSVVPHFDSVEADIEVTVAKTDDFTQALFLAAAERFGLPFNPDYNSIPFPYGASPFQFLISDSGRRETTYSAFIQRHGWPNIAIRGNVLVNSIELDSANTAVGVRYTHLDAATTTTARAAKEVILSAGAIGSPQILMLSGIGDGSQLARHGIRTNVHLPGVGQNLQDDLYVTALFTARRPMPPQPYGLMGAVIFGCSSAPPSAPTDVECSLASGTMPGLDLPRDLMQSYIIYPNVQLLQSRGTVALSSSNPADAPLIDPNYLSAPSDLPRCIDALQFARSIGNASALSDWRLQEVFPGPNVRTRHELAEHVRSTAGTCFHYAGTCKMGVDGMSVVDPSLKVRGVKNLRVIDASVIPTTVSGNTAAATMMIADKGAQLVLAT
ncbi:GMC oxidoreductase [Sorangium sp. So ce134]